MESVTTADEATRIAVEFLRRYRPVVLPLKAHKVDDVWVVEVDVGIFQVIRGWVKVSAATGAILEYELPR